MKAKTYINAFLRTVLIVLSCVLITACDPPKEKNPKTSAQIMQEAKADCWQCNLFTMVYNAGGQTAAQVYNNTVSGAASLVMLGFGIWMLIELMKHLSSVKFEEPAEFWKKILHKLFVCFVCSVMVSSPSNVLWVVNSIVTPVFVGFIEFADAIMTGGGGCSLSGSSSEVGAGNVFPSGPGSALECLVGELHGKLCIGKALGHRLIMDEDSEFDARLAGIVIIVVFAIIDLVFPFYLIDSIIRLGLTLSLVPLFVMAFAFESTRGFTKKGFSLLVNSGMTMAMMCVVVTLMADTITKFIGETFPFVLDPGAIDAGGDQLQEFAGTGLGFVTLIALGFLTFSAATSAPSIASSLAGAGAGLDGIMSTMVKAAGLLMQAMGGPLGNAMKTTEKFAKRAKRAGKVAASTAKGAAGGAAKGAAKGGAKGAKVGAKIGSAIPVVGTAIGGAVGAAVGAAGGAAAGAAKGAVKGAAKGMTKAATSK